MIDGRLRTCVMNVILCYHLGIAVVTDNVGVHNLWNSRHQQDRQTPCTRRGRT